MKRSKNDHIRSTISRYFKRRQFTESEMSSRKDARREHSVRDLAVRRQTRSSASVENTLALTSISGDATACDQQFARLKTLIITAPTPYKSQLDILLFPMFVNVYLEILCNGQKVAAHKFYDCHSETFEDATKHQQAFLQLIRRLETKSEVLTNKTVIEFRENRTLLKTDQETLDYLMRFLKTGDSMILLQLFNQYVQSYVTDSLNNNGIELNSLPDVKGEEEGGDINSNNNVTPPQQPPPGEEVEGGADATTAPSATAMGDNSEVPQQQEQQRLEEELTSAIKTLRDCLPSLPSICFLTFMNTYQGLCSAVLSGDKKCLSGSFEDGSISVWNLEPELFTRAPVSCDPSRVTLAADFIHRTEGEIKDNLNSRTNQSPERATLQGHRGAVYKACFLQDSQAHLLSCSEDATVRLWNMDTQTNSVIYKGHASPVWDVTLSSTDTWFASCSRDTTAKLWTFDRTFPLRSYIGHSMDVDCVAFHPNNNYLATGSADKTVRFWSVTEARAVRLLQGHRGSVLALAFSPNGKLLAAAGEDRRVRVWDIGSGHVVKELRGHSDTVYALAFDEQSRLLASGGSDCCVRLWDVSRGADAQQSEGHSSRELLGAFPTKSALISYLSFSQHNILYAAGASS